MRKFTLYIILSLILIVNLEAKDTIGCIRSFKEIQPNFSFDNRFIGQKANFGVGGWGSFSIAKINSKPDVLQLKTQNDLNFISFVNDFEGFIVGNNGTILFSRDAGMNWFEQNSKTKEDLNSIFCLDKKNCWVVGNKGTFLSTTNGGETWENIGTGQIQQLSSVAFTSNSKGWAVGHRGIVLQTSNGGKNWDKVKNVDFQPTNMINANGTWWKAIEFFTKSFGCFAGDNRIVCTSDGGKNWRKIEIEENDEGYDFMSFSIFNNNPVVLEECGKDFVSNDLGKTWIKK